MYFSIHSVRGQHQDKLKKMSNKWTSFIQGQGSL